jgi:hypothetical protein
MKRITVATIIFLMAIFTMANAAEFKGYLSDALCGVSGLNPAGADLTMNPEKQTIKTMKAPGCVISGYGIFVYDSNYGKFIFHKFDAAGSGMAKKQIVDKFAKKDHVAIVVNGDLMDDGTIKVSRIMEDKPITIKSNKPEKD